MSEAVLKNDPAPLVDAIRRSVALKIDEINSTADAEIKKTENEVLGEIENLRQEEEMTGTTWYIKHLCNHDCIFMFSLRKNKHV